VVARKDTNIAYKIYAPVYDRVFAPSFAEGHTRMVEALDAQPGERVHALATMGAGLPSAMGAKIVHPDRKVMAIAGDGGFMMNSQELETAVRLGMDLVVLVLRDNAYGMIKWKQADMGLRDFGLDYGNPDFVRYAESYGAVGHRILQAACDKPGVHVIDVAVDYSENDRILNREIQARSALV